MFVLKMSCIDFNTAMYILPVEVLQFFYKFLRCKRSIHRRYATAPDVSPDQKLYSCPSAPVGREVAASAERRRQE